MNKFKKIRFAIFGLAVALLSIDSAGVSAAAYPDKPMRLIVGWPPGGASDVVARILAERLTARLGQSVFVDNRPGAGGNIGAAGAARSTPDGYTLFLATTSFGINPSLYEKLSFDSAKDFTAVSLVAKAPFALVVNNNMPFASVKELIDFAKANPGKLNYGSHGAGSTAHLAAELFKTMTATDIVMVPYKGGPPAVTGLLGNEVQVMFDSALTILPLAKDGRLRLLATTGATRSPVAPEVPSISETVPGYEVLTWFAVLAPAGTPSDVLAKLNAEVRAALDTPDTRDRIARVGGQVVSSTPAEAATFIHQETEKWAKVVKASGAKAF